MAIRDQQFKEGFELGAQETRHFIAERLISAGADQAFISKVTTLTAEEISSIEHKVQKQDNTRPQNSMQNHLQNPPQTMSILFRKLKDGETYHSFREAWLPTNKDTNHYFGVPTLVFNAHNVQDPSEIISVALVWANVQEAIDEYMKHQDTEDLREKKIAKITDQSAETRFCQIVDIDVLGS